MKTCFLARCLLKGIYSYVQTTTRRENEREAEAALSLLRLNFHSHSTPLLLEALATLLIAQVQASNMRAARLLSLQFFSPQYFMPSVSYVAFPAPQVSILRTYAYAYVQRSDGVAFDYYTTETGLRPTHA